MTFYKLNYNINNGDFMTDFMQYNFKIEVIELVCLVLPGQGSLIHKNRPNHGLALFTGGERVINFGTKRVTVEKNSIVYFPKGSNYSIKERKSSDCYAINFQMSDNACFEPFVYKAQCITPFFESFKSGLKFWNSKKIGYDAGVKAELYNIIFNMQSEYNLPYTPSLVIQPALEYIHSNYYKESITVPFLASLCGISTVHLNNTFLKKFAMSPIKYINNLKMMRARELLASNFYTVSEVCYLAGYNDESYFSREFKKKYGKSPRAYSKSNI